MITLCVHCKKNEGTVANKINKKTGKKTLWCNDCNNERARNYRKTEAGKKAYYEIIKRQFKIHHEKILARAKLGYQE